MPAGTTIADYLDGTRYRRYSRSVLLERRRLLAYAAACGGEEWFGAAPVDEIVATVASRLDLRAPTTLQRLEAAIEDYQDWRARTLGEGAAA